MLGRELGVTGFTNGCTTPDQTIQIYRNGVTTVDMAGKLAQYAETC